MFDGSVFMTSPRKLYVLVRLGRHHSVRLSGCVAHASGEPLSFLACRGQAASQPLHASRGWAHAASLLLLAPYASLH